MSRRHDSRKYYRYAAIVLLVVFLLSAALLFINIWERQQDSYPELEYNEQTVSYQGNQYRRKDSVETFLVLGLDKFEGASTGDSYNNDMRADFLALFIFDHDAERCSVLQINRDTMAQVGVLGVAGDKIDTVTKQIALAHTYGNGDDVSCRNTADAVSQLLLGAKINHYLSVTMDAVPLYNDLLGGVTVTVLDDFSGIDDTLVQGETVTLTGQQALTYVRSRYDVGDSSNSNRMARQKQYMEKLQELTRQRLESDQEFLVDAAVSMSDYLVSDRSVTQLQELARKFYAYEFEGILELQGEFRLGGQYMEFYPDADHIQQLVIELFYEQKD